MKKSNLIKRIINEFKTNQPVFNSFMTFLLNES